MLRPLSLPWNGGVVWLSQDWLLVWLWDAVDGSKKVDRRKCALNVENHENKEESWIFWDGSDVTTRRIGQKKEKTVLTNENWKRLWKITKGFQCLCMWENFKFDFASIWISNYRCTDEIKCSMLNSKFFLKRLSFCASFKTFQRSTI